MIKQTTDHDLLIELRTRMEDIKNDIKELKDGTTKTMADHEIRIQKMENFRTKNTVALGIYISIGVFLASLMVYHVLAK
jgi:hypothetical protein